jgi:hypothetical protein
MIEKYKYVIKNKKNNLFLSPYNYGEHWVGIERSQKFDIETGKEKPEDLVDLAWIYDEYIELKKVKLTIIIEEIENDLNKNKKEYIISKEKYLKLKNKIKLYYRNSKYNEHGTKIKSIGIVEHIIYNIIRDKFYLNGIELNKNKFFKTTENINKAKELIYDFENNINYFNIKFNNHLSKKDLKEIRNKLKKQIEE